MDRLPFPEGFLWGAASSGPQTEGAFGKKHESIMDAWFRKAPQDFYDGIGPELASDFYHQYREDFQRMKACGFNSFRTSIQWTRLILDFETGEPDPEGVRFYRDVIETAKDLGIRLILNLHHFDLPEALLEKYGGWENRNCAELFALYARTAFELFGEDIDLWTTFNEPMVIAEAGYLGRFHWPKHRNRGKAAAAVMVHTALASALAVKEYNNMGLHGKIGTILNLTPAIPRSQSAEDLEAAEIAETFFNRFFIDAAVRGTISEKFIGLLKRGGIAPMWKEEDLSLLKEGTVDFIGLNYYHPLRVKARESELECEEWTPYLYFEEYGKPGVRINPYRGWEILPECLYDIAMTVKNDYGNLPWYVSENGMGVENEARFRDAQGMIQDRYRIDFYTEHLTALHKAIEEGSNCFGFHAWTAMDCWSWNNAYKNRYGFISVDPLTEKRAFKASASWYKAIAEDNALILP